MIIICRSRKACQSLLQKVRPYCSLVRTAFKEERRKILDRDINYVVCGSRSPAAHTIFFLPGAFGSVEMDFKPIMQHLNQEKYRWIAWDPPGYGKSRPPRRAFLDASGMCSANSNHLDASYATELMATLGRDRYTLLCWSGGAVTGAVMASHHPERVAGLITWGAWGSVPKRLVAAMLKLKSLGLNSIHEDRRRQLVDMYGESTLAEMWTEWCDEIVSLSKTEEFREGGGSLLRQVMPRVQCPTLVIHGGKDSLVDASHATDISQNIKDSRVHLIEAGRHNLHLRETKEFVQQIESFVESRVLNQKS